MSLINEVYEIHLADLFGPNATITDVDYYEGFIHFRIPVDVEQEFIVGINMSVTGIFDRKLECMLTDAELQQQLSFRNALMRASTELFKKLNEEHPRPRNQGGESPSA